MVMVMGGKGKEKDKIENVDDLMIRFLVENVVTGQCSLFSRSAQNHV